MKDEFIDVSDSDLTTISGRESYFAFYEKINLSANNLGDKLGYFYTFLQCRELDLSSNGITSLETFPKLVNLKILTLDKNAVKDAQEVLNLIKNHKLSRISLKNNPIENKELIVQFGSKYSLDIVL